MKRNRIKLTESQLHRVIKESVKRILKEEIDMGQVPSCQDKRDSLNGRDDRRNPILIKRLKALRKKLSDESLSEEESQEITNQIKAVKKQLGYK